MSFWLIDATGQTWLQARELDPADNIVDVSPEDVEPLSDEYELVHTQHGDMRLDACRSIIKHALRNSGVWEPRISELISRHTFPGSTAIDVGANNGVHTLTMSKAAGSNGRVYAFEPQMKMYRELRANIEENSFATNVIPVRAAVGAVESTVSLAIHVDEAKTRVCDEGGGRVEPGGDVRLLALDSLEFRNVSLIKIDVEGAENAVLEGATETLKRERPVVLLEIQGGYIFGEATKDKRMEIYHTIRMLEDLNYRVIQLEKWDYLAFPIL